MKTPLKRKKMSTFSRKRSKNKINNKTKEDRTPNEILKIPSSSNTMASTYLRPIENILAHKRCLKLLPL